VSKKSLPQQGLPVAIENSIVYRSRIVAPVNRFDLFFMKQALFRQQVQINKIGVSRIAGKALVRRIANAGRSQGQHLPVPLA
jgi:hypothetical protein